MLKFVSILALTLLIAGCKGDGGGGSVFSSLFDSGSSSSFSTSGGSSLGGSFDSGGSGVQAQVNPEPSTMILLGVGLAGLAIAKRLKKKHK